MRLPRLSKRAGLALACAASALVFGSAVLPARWLLALQPDDAPLVLADAAGTLWNGAAWIALGPPGARRMLPQPLHWQWRWSSLTLELSHPWLQGRYAPAWAGTAWPCRRNRCGCRPRCCRHWARPGIRWRPRARWKSAGRHCAWAPPCRKRPGRVALARCGHRPVAGGARGHLCAAGARRRPRRRHAGAQHRQRPAGGHRPGQPQRPWRALPGPGHLAAGATEAERGALDGLMSALGRRSDDTVVFGTGK
ncbi:type II secretion system protein N [Achromobacter xylosoxidans]